MAEAPGTRPPLLFVFGAFGAGKSTLSPLVAAGLPECFVVDVDWLLGPLGRIAGHDLTEDPNSWPHLRDFWLQLASMAARASRPSLFFGPEEPENIEGLPSRPLLGESHWLLIDCDDTVLTERLGRRPGWQPAWTADALSDAARFRSLGFPSVRTDTIPPADSAGQIIAWARSQIA
ncbi:MAG TPA: hypothetical protein VH951_03080 [Dehalococcoidia bacterium]|jgi:hypothetical protein